MNDAQHRLWILGGLAVAAGVGLVVVANSQKQTILQAPSSPTKTPTSTKKRVFPGARMLLLGDSLAVGLKAPMGQLANDFGVSFRARGVVGSRIADWAKSTSVDEEMAFGPTIVMLSIGTNDMKMLSPVSEKKDLGILLSKLGSGGADVVIIGPPKMPFPDNGVRQMLASSGATVFPSDALIIPRGPDKIHPTAKGYSGWAGAIWAWLG